MHAARPNFIYAGAPKAGSSSIYELLKQHPEIYMSSVKEPFFFDFNYECGIDWYLDHFQGWNGERAVGEATVWYMRWASVPQRVYEHFPDMRFLFVLRNPVERLWSNYWNDLQGGQFGPGYTISQAIRDEADPRGMRMAGFYHEHLVRFERLFGKDQIHVALLDDFRKDPDKVLEGIFEFVGVSPDFRPSSVARKKVSPAVRWPSLLKGCSSLGKLMSKWFAVDPFDSAWKKSRHFRYLFLTDSLRPTPFDAEDLRYARDLYREDVKRLESWMNRDLSHWVAD